MKFIFVSGGVISGIGKGIVSSSIAKMLSGITKLTVIKIDPYLNKNSGLMNPGEHGECFVLEDGSEVDLDFGSYERFLDIRFHSWNSITLGKVLKIVSDKEDTHGYGGSTIRLIRNLSEEVVNMIECAVAKDKSELCIIELGGTIDDEEAKLFLEALRKIRKKYHTLTVHVAPILYHLGEAKLKPLEKSVQKLRKTYPVDILVVSSTELDIPDAIKKRIYDLAEGDVYYNYYTDIYLAPKQFMDQGMHKSLGKLGVSVDIPIPFTNIVSILSSVCPKKVIGIPYKYRGKDTYVSLVQAIRHAAYSRGYSPEIKWITDAEDVKSTNCVIIPGGFGTNFDMKLSAIRICRINGIPILGICLGFQLMLIEYLSSIGLDATSEEFMDSKKDKVIVRIVDSKNMNGTMRLGTKVIELQESLISKVYGCYEISERFRHRYGFNKEYISYLKDIIVTDKNLDNVATIEYTNGRGIGVQYHPEYQTYPDRPHPLFTWILE